MALRQEEFTSLCDDVDLDRDRALVERCQAGDSAAFGNLYARYYERLLRFCLRRLNDRHEAEDAAQEAFARAWKALPNFAGERRFYPWLTVIAGNICTDMLRRRSRSTPTDDVELNAANPDAAVSDDTSDLVLAAVDGELVNQALGRLSTRHRHVLAMREGSGWSYQQIADHEGVEIGTIETLLWRARQALKREFAVVSDSKEALAGFLVATGAVLRRTVFRVAHRGASMQQNAGASGGGGGMGLRNAVAGVAVTGAAVAAAIITPHALSSGPPPATIALAAPSTVAAADPSLPVAVPTPIAVPGAASDDSSSAISGDAGAAAASPLTGSLPANTDSSATANGINGSGPLSQLPSPGGTGVGSGLSNLPDSPVGKGLGSLTTGVSNTLNTVTGGLTNTVTNTLGTTLGSTVNGLANTLGVTNLLSEIGLTPAKAPAAGATTGSAASGTSASGTSTSSPTTTPTTAISLLGQLGSVAGSTVKTLLGGK